MKYAPIGLLVPALFERAAYEYTAKALPELDMKAFKKRHLREYKAMVSRAEGIGSMKENMFAIVPYLACYGFSYYKAAPDRITMDIFDGMVNAICTCDRMKCLYKNKDCFSQAEIDKYVRGAERSQKREYSMDWVFDFSYDLTVPEYYITHHECGVCKIGQKEDLTFLIPHMCVMDYPTIEYKKGKLLRTKTLGNGDDCCDFHVVRP